MLVLLEVVRCTPGVRHLAGSIWMGRARPQELEIRSALVEVKIDSLSGVATGILNAIGGARYLFTIVWGSTNVYASVLLLLKSSTGLLTVGITGIEYLVAPVLGHCGGTLGSMRGAILASSGEVSTSVQIWHVQVHVCARIVFGLLGYGLSCHCHQLTSAPVARVPVRDIVQDAWQSAYIKFEVSIIGLDSCMQMPNKYI